MGSDEEHITSGIASTLPTNALAPNMGCFTSNSWQFALGNSNVMNAFGFAALKMICERNAFSSQR
jgi:hypothetical protein